MSRHWSSRFIGSCAAAAVSLVLAAVVAARMAGAGWEAVAALASVFSALGTGAAALTLYFAAREFDRREQERSEQLQRDRVSQKPYLRVDVAFAESIARENSLSLRAGLRIYSAKELGIDDELAQFREGVGPRHDGDLTFRLLVAISNLQRQPLGIADEVEVLLAAGWEGDQSAQFPIRLAYLAPGQTTAVEVATVRRAISGLAVEVKHVVYKDLFQDSMPDAHGAMRMYYTWDQLAGKARIQNERKVQRAEIPPDSRDSGSLDR